MDMEPPMVKTWTYDWHPPGDGPWRDEPDKAQWIDEATDLDCLAVRAHHGAWCGYVGVPLGHPWFGKDRHDMEDVDVDVYDEISYGAFCDEAANICHVPEPGRSDHVWWIGFSCMTSNDILPIFDQLSPDFRDRMGRSWMETRLSHGATYKPLAFVMDEVRLLALQAEVARR